MQHILRLKTYPAILGKVGILVRVARLYRIPPHMVGDLDKSSFSNIEQQSLEFVKYTLDPWVIRWEQSILKSPWNPPAPPEFSRKVLRPLIGIGSRW